MADNPGGKIASSALAQLHTWQSHSKNGMWTHQEDHLKVRATTNEITCEPSEGGVGVTERKQGGEGSRAVSLRVSCYSFPDTAFPSFKARCREYIQQQVGTNLVNVRVTNFVSIHRLRYNEGVVKFVL